MKSIDFYSTPSTLSVWESIYNDLTESLSDFYDLSRVTNRTSSKICTSDFPKSDIFEDTDGSYNIVLAVAGIPKEKQKLSFKDNYLTWSLVEEEKVEKDEEVEEKKDVKDVDAPKVKWIQKGIKNPTKATASFYIPQHQYDVEKLNVSLDNGLLKINVPKKDSYVLKADFEIK